MGKKKNMYSELSDTVISTLDLWYEKLLTDEDEFFEEDRDILIIDRGRKLNHYPYQILFDEIMKLKKEVEELKKNKDDGRRY